MKRILLVPLLCGLGLSTFGATPSPNKRVNGPKPARDGARFLFVVDTSASMKSIDPGTRQTVFDLIFSGVDGYMRTGDTFGVWSFNEKVGAGLFPMQVWDGATPLDVASRVAMFIREQEYTGDNRMEDLIMKISAISRAATNVNVLIISDGDTRVQGTPLDREINAAYSLRAKERKAAKMPFITTLIVENGRMVRSFVTLPGESIPLPARPAPLPAAGNVGTPVATNGAAPITAAPAPVAVNPVAKASVLPAAMTIPTALPPAVEPPPPRSESPDSTSLAQSAPTSPDGDHSVPPPQPAAPLTSPPRKVMQIITKPSRAAEKPEETELEKVTTPSESTAARSPATTVVTVPEVPTASAIVSQVTPAVGVEAPVPNAAPVQPPGTAREPALLAVVAPAPVVVAAREPSPPVTKPVVSGVMTAVQAPAHSGLGAIPTLIIGGILLAMSLFLLGIALRRMRHEPQGSLITQSMHRR